MPVNELDRQETKEQELFSQDRRQPQPGQDSPFGPTREAEERRLMELQRRQRQESIRALGFDVLESHCPHCGENYCMVIKDPGKPLPAFLKPFKWLLPGLRGTGAVLHCFACDRDSALPSLLAELSFPILICLFIALIGLADLWLMAFVCHY